MKKTDLKKIIREALKESKKTTLNEIDVCFDHDGCYCNGTQHSACDNITNSGDCKTCCYDILPTGGKTTSIFKDKNSNCAAQVKANKKKKKTDLKKIIREEIEKLMVETPSTAVPGCDNSTNGECAHIWFQWRRNKMSGFMNNKTCAASGPYTFGGVLNQFGNKYGNIKNHFQNKINNQGNTAVADPVWVVLEQSVTNWSDIKFIVHQLAAYGNITNNNKKDRLMRVVAKMKWATCMKSPGRCNC